MASLKEIRARIASVRSTLKITSAMKMVASAKLHRVQGTAEALAEYARRLGRIAAALREGDPEIVASSPLAAPHEVGRRAVVVAFSSDGSLCGARPYNALLALAGSFSREIAFYTPAFLRFCAR